MVENDFHLYKVIQGEYKQKLDVTIETLQR